MYNVFDIYIDGHTQFYSLYQHKKNFILAMICICIDSLLIDRPRHLVL